MCRLSLVVLSRGYSALRYSSFSLWWLVAKHKHLNWMELGLPNSSFSHEEPSQVDELANKIRQWKKAFFRYGTEEDLISHQKESYKCKIECSFTNYLDWFFTNYILSFYWGKKNQNLCLLQRQWLISLKFWPFCIHRYVKSVYFSPLVLVSL